ncbi:hypothetical protein ABE85_04930 [Mitsuaria sp. 7]|nr:hypothetical protein ABE85_04930 [Mitsuaria sp. 7]
MGLAVVLLALAALQVLNHREVRNALCAVDGMTCTSSAMPVAIDSRGMPAGVPPSLLANPLRLETSTALIRQRCDGQWTVALGARIRVDPLSFGDRGDSDGACIDVFRSSARVSLASLRLRHGLGPAQCVVRLEPTAVDWDDAFVAKLSARVAPETVAACSALLPQSPDPAAAQQLVAQTMDLDVRFGIPYAQRDRLFKPAEAGDASTGGWLRRALSSMDTLLDLRIGLSGGKLSVRFSTSPAQAPAKGSPELTLALGAEGSVLALLPEPLKSTITPTQPLRIRWQLDHDNGRVLVNDQVVERLPAQARPAGPTPLAAAECQGLPATAPPLYFVEAGDRGEAAKPEQTRALFSAVEAANAASGAIVSVFVHGWQHSAASGDSYACDYAKLMSAVDTMEQQAARASGRPARQVIGAYVGWPGRMYPGEIANVTTFWNRLQAADRLGADGALLREVMSGLSQRVAARTSDPRADRRSVFVVTGHSMGGRAVFNAVRDGLSPKVMAPKPDLILLVNPAFSAELYRAIHDQERQCHPIGVPLLSFSSEADGVTRQVYPAGQAVTFDSTAARHASFPEHVYTAANFGEFVTHRLRMEVLRDPPPSPLGEQTVLRGFPRVPEGDADELYSDNPVTVFRQPESGRPARGDVWYRMALTRVGPPPEACPDGASRVVEVDARILPDHGTIFTPAFMEYVVRALNRSVVGTGPAQPGRTTAGRP